MNTIPGYLRRLVGHLYYLLCMLVVLFCIEVNSLTTTTAACCVVYGQDINTLELVAAQFFYYFNYLFTFTVLSFLYVFLYCNTTLNLEFPLSFIFFSYVVSFLGVNSAKQSFSSSLSLN